jgi:AraC-like DNA-binding protein
MPPMSAIGDVLPSLRLRASGFAVAELSSPWALSIEADTTTHLAAVLEGSCHLAVEDEPGRGEPERRELAAGDVVLLPRGEAYRLAQPSSHPPTPLARIATEPGPGLAARITRGGAGPRAVLLVGSFASENELGRSLMSALPTVVHVRRNHPQIGVWLAAMRLEAEGRPLGGETMIVRLAEILLLYVIRTYLERPHAELRGWLGALAEPQLGRALSRMHREPGQRWTVASLASAAALSRAAFFRHFCDSVGEPPLAYLRRVRMHLASEALRDPNATVLEVGSRVGYDSEAAFSRAFKRHFGVSPASFRRSSGVR